MGLSQQGKHGSLLVIGHVEKIGDVAFRHRDHMPATHGVVVVTHIREIAIQQDINRMAQLAGQDSSSRANCAWSSGVSVRPISGPRPRSTTVAP